MHSTTYSGRRVVMIARRSLGVNGDPANGKKQHDPNSRDDEVSRTRRRTPARVVRLKAGVLWFHAARARRFAAPRSMRSLTIRAVMGSAVIPSTDDAARPSSV